MSTDKLLALYHFSSQWHGGQSSQGYRILSRVKRRLRARGITDPSRERLSPRARGYYGHLCRKWRGCPRMRWF